jgi:glycosyltransferase involved in cell wall biosynthesis
MAARPDAGGQRPAGAPLRESATEGEGASKIVALIPAHNEAARIGATAAGARRHLPVLVVDDGSDDDTAARAEAAEARVMRQSPNQGKGAALRAGFRLALSEGCEAVLTLDADGQHDPAEIPSFLEKFAARQIDLLVGERDFSQMPLIRRIANTFSRWSFSWAVGQGVRDNQSGYRLISRRMMESVLDSREQGFEFEVEMIETCVRRRYVLDWVPIRTIYADQGSHIQAVPHMLRFFRTVWRTWRRRKRWERGPNGD